MSCKVRGSGCQSHRACHSTPQQLPAASVNVTACHKPCLAQQLPCPVDATPAGALHRCTYLEQGCVMQAVVAVGQHNIHGAFRDPAGQSTRTLCRCRQGHVEQLMTASLPCPVPTASAPRACCLLLPSAPAHTKLTEGLLESVSFHQRSLLAHGWRPDLLEGYHSQCHIVKVQSNQQRQGQGCCHWQHHDACCMLRPSHQCQQHPCHLSSMYVNMSRG